MVFQCESIRAALDIAGLRVDNSQTLDDEEPRILIIAWSSRERLLLEPEYAWLSVDAVQYIQLPQPLATLRQKLEGESRLLQPPAALSVLSTPLGQWRWALHALEAGFQDRINGEGPTRLQNLQRFASTHWPGWYETALSKLRCIFDSALSAHQQIELLDRQADAVAVCEACRPLFDWTDGGSKRNRISVLRDTISYVSQNLANIDEVNRIAERDPWWNDLRVDLLACESTLPVVELGGAAVQELVGSELRQVKHHSEAIQKSMTVKESRCEDLKDAHKAIENLVCALDDLSRFRSQAIAAIGSLTSNKESE